MPGAIARDTPRPTPKCAVSLALTRQTEKSTRVAFADNFTLHYVRHVGCIIITMGGVFRTDSAAAMLSKWRPTSIE